MKEGVALGVVLAQDEVHAASHELRLCLLEAHEFAAPDEVALLHAFTFVRCSMFDGWWHRGIEQNEQLLMAGPAAIRNRAMCSSKVLASDESEKESYIRIEAAHQTKLFLLVKLHDQQDLTYRRPPRARIRRFLACKQLSASASRQQYSFTVIMSLRLCVL